MKLRPYQHKAVQDVLNAMHKHKTLKGVVVMPTGSGKSHIIAELANAIEGNILVLQPSKELLEQNLDKFEVAGGDAKIFSASFNSKEIGKVTFGTIMSVVKKPDLFKDKKISLVVQDECHTHSNKSKLNEFLKKIKVNHVIGLTATPIYLSSTLEGAMLKMMNRVKGGFYNKIIHITQIEDIFEDYWTPLEYRRFDFDGSRLILNSSGSDYTERSLIESYEWNNTKRRINEILDEIDDEIKSSLIFVPSIAQAEELASRNDMEVISSHTKPSDRKSILTSFKNGNIKHLVNVNIFSIGFNYPELDCVITSRATNSMAIYYQQIGRVCRPYPGKKKGLIVDLSGNVDKFGYLEDISFQEVENYGWGMFKGKNLLTRVTMKSVHKGQYITIENLEKGVEPNVEENYYKFKKYNNKKDSNVLNFGKHKGKTIDYVIDNDKKYLEWMINNPDWDWSWMMGTKNIIMQKLETVEQ